MKTVKNARRRKRPATWNKRVIAVFAAVCVAFAGLTVRLDKADLYSLLREYAPPEKLMEEIPPLFGRRPELQKLGFRLDPEEVRISLRVKLGFLSLPLQLAGDVEAVGDGLRLTPRTVYLGPLVHISAGKLAELLHQPELTEALLISPSEYGAAGVTLRAGKDEVLLHLPVPPMLPPVAAKGKHDGRPYFSRSAAATASVSRTAPRFIQLQGPAQT